MAFADRVEAAVARIGNATAKANIDAAADTFRTAVYAEVITRCGRDATEAAWTAIEDSILETLRQCDTELADAT